MSDTAQKLVYMANQIARNFANRGEEGAAMATAEHIVQFWDPRMKAGLPADAPGLTGAARAAMELVHRRTG